MLRKKQFNIKVSSFPNFWNLSENHSTKVSNLFFSFLEESFEEFSVVLEKKKSLMLLEFKRKAFDKVEKTALNVSRGFKEKVNHWKFHFL